ncbi:MAG: branched-chain amino acid transport system substrate-binding protein [Nocardioidaceae bacterium]|jgi:branched-chain amino acid transport system substrate-binding protein|nr:branched-chain amino acid transport system substrate-binding protein [Nocardioidaceae bacterium]
MASLCVMALTATTLAACGASTPDGSGGGSGDIKLGVIAPLTGPASTLKPIVDGMQVYFDKVNEEGGIDGRKVKLIVKDDAYDPSKTPGQARTLIEKDKVDMLCGPIGTGPTSAIYQYVTQQKVPTLALSGSPEFAGPDSTVFQQLPDYAGLGQLVADLAVKDLAKKKVAIAYSPDGVGEPFKEGAEKELEKLGVTPTLVEFNPKSPDQSTVASKLKASGADIVLINHVAPIVTAISKAASQQGYEPTYASTFALNDSKFKELAAGTLDDSYIVSPFLIGSEPEAKEYRDAVTKSGSVDPLDPVVIEGWSTADVCSSALEKAAQASGGEGVGRESILEAMADLTVDTTYIRDLTWSKTDHTGQKNARVSTFDGDKFVTYKDATDFPESTN